ncbi:MAG: phosphatase PAP2 family protein [Candidatus Pacebacteria bacterium]|nr:phosphatase PAP2 family protein [Candidatus Paceibacterota bacterium]
MNKVPRSAVVLVFASFMLLDNFLMENMDRWALRHFWPDVLAIFLAQYFPYVLGAFFALFLLVNFRRYWWMFLEGVCASAIAWLSVGAFGWLFARPRPFVSGSFRIVLPYPATSPSFPSTHAAVFFALATVVFLYNKKAGLFFFLGAIIIGLARVFCGLHWLSDVLAGMVLGTFLGFLAHFLPRRLWRLGRA